MLAILALVEGALVVHRASLAQFVARQRRRAGSSGLLELALGGGYARSAVGVSSSIGVELIGFLRADNAAPFHQLFQSLVSRIVGNAAIASHVLHVGRAAAIQGREHLLQVRLQGTGLHAAHLGIASQRHSRHPEAGLTPGKAHRRAGKTEHELGHANAERASRQKVAALVDEHEEADGDDGAHEHDENIHSLTPLDENRCSPASVPGGPTGVYRRPL